ncbi:MAG: M23 family metallopeptidase [Bacteroidota bacterium]
MGRTKYYYYDIKTCSYEQVRRSVWRKVGTCIGYLTLSLVLGVAITHLYYSYFDSPKEYALKQENETLRVHYEIIQKELEKGRKVLTLLQDRDDHIYRTIFEAEPIPTTVRQAGVGGIDRYRALAYKDPIITHTLEQVDQLKRQIYIQAKSYDELTKLAMQQEKRLAAIPAIQPISNKELKYIGSGFGMRRHPIHKIYKMHTGMDFPAPRGTPIYATGNGIVKAVKRSATYGNYVDIHHGYGFMTRYAHLDASHVRPGQAVKRGECIGRVGNTGVSTAPHLHYEVIKHGKHVDPAHYFFNDLNASEYETLIRLAAMKNQSMD